MNFLTINTKHYVAVLFATIFSFAHAIAQTTSAIQVTPLANITVECNAIPILINPIVKTTCEGGKVNITFTETKITGICPETYTLIRKWNLTDLCANKTTVEQKITVKDTKAPAIGLVTNITAECSNIPIVVKPSVVDNCSKNITPTLVETKENSGLCADAYRILRTWTASDACGNKATKTQYITVSDKTKPTFANIPANITVECIAIPHSTTPSASDNCDKKIDITYKETTLAGTTINTICSYTLKREWTATDNCGNSNIATQLITIKDSKAPKFTTTITDITVSCAKVPLAINPGAVDNCTKEVKVTVIETKTSTGCPDAYLLKRVWTATDNCGNATNQTQLITVQDKTAPSLFGVPSNVTMSCSQIMPIASKSVTAADECDKQIDIVFKETKVNGNCPDTYGIKREWTAKDDCGNAVTRTQNITVRDNLPPLFAQVPLNITVECNKIPNSSPIYASDNCDKQIDIVLKESKNNGICANSYVLTRTWTATDNCGNSKVTSQNIIVNDFVAPKLVNVPTNLTLDCKDILPAAPNVNVTDNCATNSTSTMNENITTVRCTKTIQRTWSATDACGNSTAATQTIKIEDNEPPAPVVTPPATITLACGVAVPIAPALMFKDRCTENVTVSYAEEIIDSNDPNCSISKIIRRWTAKDTCGNATVITQTVLIGNQGSGNKEMLENKQIIAKENATKENALAQNELAYPNPTDGALFISLKEKTDEVRLSDELGRIIYTKENIAPNTLNIDLSTFENGIYHLQIKIGNTQKTQRIILLKQ
jgi:large repetitive protein